MIDFGKTKELLIPILLSYGFVEDKIKSSRNNRVFKKEADKLLLRSTANNGVYDYYKNLHNDRDFGDSIAFLTHREFGISLQRFDREQYKKIESIVERISSVPIITNVAPIASKPQSFDFNRYSAQPLGQEVFNDENNQGHLLPLYDRLLLEKRHLSADIVAEDIFKTSIAIIDRENNGRSYKNSVFLWRDIDNKISGAQYRFLNKEEKVEKRFLKDTNRFNSLWITQTEQKKFLFICEDPIDALSHYSSLSPINRADIAYACSGGSLTHNQIDLIHKLASKYQLKIVLGNDNDIAGQISNFKIMDGSTSSIQFDKERATITNNLSGETQNFSLSDLRQLNQNLASAKGYYVKFPLFKDWNEDLAKTPQKKSPILSSVLTKSNKTTIIAADLVKSR